MEINKIICGDCREVMTDIPDKSIDMVLTSPPYDNLRTYKGYTFNFEGIAKELYRVLKDGGVVVWVVGDATIKGSETGTSFKQALYFKEIGFNLHDTMIWEKNSFNHDPRNKRYKQHFEYNFILSKGKPKTYNEIKDVPVKNAGKRYKSSKRLPSGFIKSEETRRKPKGGFMIAKIPDTAPETLAEGEFNRFYIRGLCVDVSNSGDNLVEVYRGKEVSNPRSESEAMIGKQLSAKDLLNDLRSSIGVDTAFGLPSGPNSGLTICRINN